MGLSTHAMWLATLLAISMCVFVGLIYGVWRSLPYQPRRPVPWQAIDLAVVIFVYLALQSGVIELAQVVLGEKAAHAPAMAGTETTTQHVIAQLMSKGGALGILICLFSAAVAAPVAEEFFFRVLLQGWLESLGHHWRRQIPTLRRLLPRGLGPILITSFLFARMHFRVETPPMNARFVIFLLAGDAVARLLTVAFAVGFLRWRVGATAADFGWIPRKILNDVKLGLVAFGAVVVPVYALHIGVSRVLPLYLAPDPVPLFFLALVLGTLFYRTHRIVPAVVLHAALNAMSLLLVLL